MSEQALRELMDLEAEMHALRMEREQLRLHALLMKQQERAREGGHIATDSQDGSEPGPGGLFQASLESDVTLQSGVPRRKQGGSDRGVRGWSGRTPRSRRANRRLTPAVAPRQHLQPAAQEEVLQQEAVDGVEAGLLLSQHQDLTTVEDHLQHHPPAWEVRPCDTRPARSRDLQRVSAGLIRLQSH
jgi:hypothetical protein